MKRSLLVATAALASGGAAQAGEVYANIGLTGLVVGYAVPIHRNVVLRADLATLGHRSRDKVAGGIAYAASIRAQRFGAYLDWYLWGDIRATTGVTFNDFRADMSARGQGGQITIGGTTYATGPDDRFDVRVRFPRVTPYLGIGYGHQSPDTRGFGFVADLGVSIGRVQVDGHVSGPLLTAAVSPADVQAELDQLRNTSIGKIRILPQVSVGINYKF